MRRAVAYAGVAALLLTFVIAAADRIFSLTPGLDARYSQGDRPAPAVARIDTPPLSVAVAAAPVGGGFTVTWAGQLWVPRTGRYTFAINADAGTSLFVDGHALFDNVRLPAVQFASSEAALASGAHAIFISYATNGRSPRVDLMWAADGAPLAGIPASALQPRRVSRLRLQLARSIDPARAALAWIWAFEFTALLILVFAAIGASARSTLVRESLWRPLRWILAASVCMNAAGLWWGLPAQWVQIELSPPYIIDAWTQRFLHGWYDAYPPIHFYVLAAALSPFLVLRGAAHDLVYGRIGHDAMFVVTRLVSLAAGAGIVAAIALIGARAFGRRAGLFAAAAFSVVAPFLFYAKTANVDVPYVFWFALSMVFYLRVIESLRATDFIAFAAAGMLAIGTKDQAYGLYVLAPFVFIGRLWQSHREAQHPAPLLRAVLDRRLIVAALAALVLFLLCFDVPFNFSGFVEHVRFITGPGSGDYRLYPPTAAGRLALLLLTAHLLRVSLGWPLLISCAAGVSIALARPSTRVVALALLAPVIGYYATFVNVVLYNYDRFMLPVCVILALFAGVFFRVLSARRYLAPIVAAVFAYTCLYAVTVDVLMIGDARYDARAWMLTHVSPDDIVAVTEFPELVPRLDGFRTIGVATVPELAREQPRFVVLNADYARSATPGSPWADLVSSLEHESAGYRLAASFRHPSPWPWLPAAHPDLVGDRRSTVVLSVLRDINPTTEIFERDGSAR